MSRSAAPKRIVKPTREIDNVHDPYGLSAALTSQIMGLSEHRIGNIGQEKALSIVDTVQDEQHWSPHVVKISGWPDWPCEEHTLSPVLLATREWRNFLCSILAR